MVFILLFGCVAIENLIWFGLVVPALRDTTINWSSLHHAKCGHEILLRAVIGRGSRCDPLLISIENIWGVSVTRNVPCGWGGGCLLLVEGG